MQGLTKSVAKQGRSIDEGGNLIREQIIVI